MRNLLAAIGAAVLNGNSTAACIVFSAYPGETPIIDGTGSGTPAEDFDGNPRPSGQGYDMGRVRVSAHRGRR